MKITIIAIHYQAIVGFKSKKQMGITLCHMPACLFQKKLFAQIDFLNLFSEAMLSKPI